MSTSGRWSSFLRVAITGLVVAAVTACDHSTAIDAPGPVPFNARIAGTYDVSVVLDTFSFETPARSPTDPDCPQAVLYCTHFRTSTVDARLSGTLIVDASGIPKSDGTYEVTFRGTFGGRHCDAIDRERFTGCVSTRPIDPLPYADTSLWRDSLYATRGAIAGIRLISVPPDIYAPWISLEAFYEGDSLRGRLVWGLFMARSPPTFWGTFVAKKRR
jgi:hypothetical protein